MKWFRKTGDIQLKEDDIRMLSASRDGEALIARVLSGESPSPALPPVLNQRMLPMLMCPRFGFSEYIREYYALLCLSRDPSHAYVKHLRFKRDGKLRTVYEVTGRLKRTQKWILREILDYLPLSKSACAYRKGYTLLDNVRPHVGQKILVKLDISDFFGATKFPAVYDVFHSAGYDKPVAVLLARLCCLNGALPQGSAASPALSNLCFARCDAHIEKYCLSHSIAYTRYSDDMSFSGDFDPYALIAHMSSLLAFFGYAVNREKTRIFRQGQRQSVTGIVVNTRPQVTKEYRKKLRQELYYVEKYGLYDSYLHKMGTDPHRSGNDFVRRLGSLQGSLGYALFVDPQNKELIHYQEILTEQLEKMREEWSRTGWFLPAPEGRLVLPEALRLNFAGRTLFWVLNRNDDEDYLSLSARAPSCLFKEDDKRLRGSLSVGIDGSLTLPAEFAAMTKKSGLTAQSRLFSEDEAVLTLTVGNICYTERVREFIDLGDGEGGLPF